MLIDETFSTPVFYDVEILFSAESTNINSNRGVMISQRFMFSPLITVRILGTNFLDSYQFNLDFAKKVETIASIHEEFVF